MRVWRHGRELRSSVQLIEKLAGVTPEEARAMVRVGEVLTTGGEGHTALVAEAALAGLGIETAQICPWALREGLILRRFDHLQSA